MNKTFIFAAFFAGLLAIINCGAAQALVIDAGGYDGNRYYDDDRRANRGDYDRGFAGRNYEYRDYRQQTVYPYNGFGCGNANYSYPANYQTSYPAYSYPSGKQRYCYGNYCYDYVVDGNYFYDDRYNSGYYYAPGYANQTACGTSQYRVGCYCYNYPPAYPISTPYYYPY